MESMQSMQLKLKTEFEERNKFENLPEYQKDMFNKMLGNLAKELEQLSGFDVHEQSQVNSHSTDAVEPGKLKWVALAREPSQQPQGIHVAGDGSPYRATVPSAW